MKKIILSTLSVLALLGAVYASNAFAHCDTLDGPVVATARTALEKGDVTPLLKWVRPENEKKIQAAFRKTLAMRAKGADVKEFAEMYFFWSHMKDATIWIHFYRRKSPSPIPTC